MGFSCEGEQLTAENMQQIDVDSHSDRNMVLQVVGVVVNCAIVRAPATHHYCCSLKKETALQFLPKVVIPVKETNFVSKVAKNVPLIAMTDTNCFCFMQVSKRPISFNEGIDLQNKASLLAFT